MQSVSSSYVENMAGQTLNWDSTTTLDETFELLRFILDKWRNKPLHAAVFLKKEETARVLMVGGIDVGMQDENGNTALHAACITGNYAMVRILTTPYGVPITPEYLDQLNGAGQSCLHIAAYQNRWDLIHLLVEAGASIDVREAATGGTPLHTAVAFRNQLVIEFILSHCNSNMGITNYAGETAYRMAKRLSRRTP